jgi:hypothetical protein
MIFVGDASDSLTAHPVSLGVNVHQERVNGEIMSDDNSHLVYLCCIRPP